MAERVYVRRQNRASSSSETVRVLQDCLRHLGAAPQDGDAAPAAVRADNPMDVQARALQYFQKRNPPRFSGTGEVKEAEDWLREVRKSLALVGVPMEHRVMFATDLFHGEADRWWDIETTRRDVSTLTWEEFETIFNNSYVSTAYKREKGREFSYLQQGSLTVHQYAAKFTELSRYAPDLVAVEQRRAERFQDGLRSSIRNQMVSHRLRTYSEVVEVAMLVEADLDKDR